jgi:hypothetical protein
MISDNNKRAMARNVIPLSCLVVQQLKCLNICWFGVVSFVRRFPSLEYELADSKKCQVCKADLHPWFESRL